MVTLKIKIGNSVLEYQADGNDVKSIHRFSSIYGMLPEKCDACESLNIYLSWKNPKGNDYYTIACKSCGAELAFHQKKEGGFYLVQGEKMTVYNPNGAPKTDQVEKEFSSPEAEQEFNKVAF